MSLVDPDGVDWLITLVTIVLVEGICWLDGCRSVMLSLVVREEASTAATVSKRWEEFFIALDNVMVLALIARFYFMGWIICFNTMSVAYVGCLSLYPSQLSDVCV